MSNFDTDDMEELFAVAGGNRCATNQILYNVGRRGPEFDLLPWMAERGVPAMAYSPVEQGRLPRADILAQIGRRHGASAFQVALAFVLRRPEMIAIPKAVDPAHLRDNRAALDLVLTEADLEQIDAAFPPPARKRPLDVI